MYAVEKVETNDCWTEICSKQVRPLAERCVANAKGSCRNSWLAKVSYFIVIRTSSWTRTRILTGHWHRNRFKNGVAVLES